MAHIKAFLGEKADFKKVFRSVLVVDDDDLFLGTLCEAIVRSQPNTVVFSCLEPEHSLALLEQAYIDVCISDINMPGMSGDKVILSVKEASPTTYTIAVTGHTFDAAFKAGRCNPDFFIDKNKGFQVILAGLKKGFAESLERRKTAFVGYYDEVRGVIGKEPDDWRFKRSIKDALGYSFKDFLDFRKRIKAVGLQLIRPHFTMEEKAFILGYSSTRLLKEHVSTFFLL
ncbi:MAG: hypothetical protein A2487_09785, partial [Candidatus Raymondbacteria bacterium RifOxyC12_full_50_8]